MFKGDAMTLVLAGIVGETANLVVRVDDPDGGEVELSVSLNGGTGTMSDAPIGGYKRSGIGREYGPGWLREYQHEKSIFYPIGR